MSLLMDALKKAEQEKKAAAKRQQESEASLLDKSVEAASRKLDNTGTWEHEVVDGNTTAEIPAVHYGRGSTGLHSITSELELEPIINADDTAEIPRMDVSAAADVEAEDPTLNVTMNELSLAELSRDQMDFDDADAPHQTHSSIEELQTDNADLDETFHGVALNGMGDNPELFQETVRGEVFLPGDGHSYGETLQGIPAVLLAKDIGSDNQPTPVSAQTVFTATGTIHSGAGFKWTLTGLGTAGLIAAIVWYYVTVTPVNRTLLSPQVAEGIEKVGPPTHETLNLDIGAMSGTLLDDAESSAIGDSGVAVVPANEVPVLQSTSSIESSSKAEQDGVQIVIDESDIELPDESGTSDSAVAAAAGSLPSKDVLTHNTEAGLPERIAPELSLIKISRSKTLDNKGKVITDAYIAYQKGAYGTAEDKYQAALKEFPDNRDALLGLGAIAANSGDYNKAYHWYARLLSISPRDEFAKAALINLQERSSLWNSESEIKSMLHDSPDAHFLHFTLGNIYAAGSRWAEAQQAFFDAYRLNSSNPDYALNLAISLDHIGQYGTALDYYNAALELSEKTPSRFDISRVKTRIDDLNKVAEL